VHGSIEAINDSLQKLSNIEVKINIVHSATGTITESDVSLGAVSNAIIVGFNVRPSARVQDMADEENVDMRFYTVIYDLIKDLKDSVLGMMASTFEERILGRAEVREVFHVPKIGAIAGSYVTDGKIERGSLLRLIREGVILYEGRNSSLRRFKDDAKEVQSGYECGRMRLHGCRSLKGKRKIIKSMIGRIRNTFNVSVAEIDLNDMYQSAEVGFVLVGNNKAVVNSKVDKVLNFAEGMGLAEIVNSEIEIIQL